MLDPRDLLEPTPRMAAMVRLEHLARLAPRAPKETTEPPVTAAATAIPDTLASTEPLARPGPRARRDCREPRALAGLLDLKALLGCRDSRELTALTESMVTLEPKAPRALLAFKAKRVRAVMPDAWARREPRELAGPLASRDTLASRADKGRRELQATMVLLDPLVILDLMAAMVPRVPTGALV